MGVMACDRDGCDKVMCDRLVYDKKRHGKYICNRCFQELYHLKQTFPKQMTKNELADLIMAFMGTEPGEHEEKGDRDVLFEQLTENRDCYRNWMEDRRY